MQQTTTTSYTLRDLDMTFVELDTLDERRRRLLKSDCAIGARRALRRPKQDRQELHFDSSCVDRSMQLPRRRLRGELCVSPATNHQCNPVPDFAFRVDCDADGIPRDPQVRCRQVREGKLVTQ